MKLFILFLTFFLSRTVFCIEKIHPTTYQSIAQKIGPCEVGNLREFGYKFTVTVKFVGGIIYEGKTYETLKMPVESVIRTFGVAMEELEGKNVKILILKEVNISNGYLLSGFKVNRINTPLKSSDQTIRLPPEIEKIAKSKLKE